MLKKLEKIISKPRNSKKKDDQSSARRSSEGSQTSKD
jgi:hypothetical protein